MRIPNWYFGYTYQIIHNWLYLSHPSSPQYDLWPKHLAISIRVSKKKDVLSLTVCTCVECASPGGCLYACESIFINLSQLWLNLRLNHPPLLIWSYTINSHIYKTPVCEYFHWWIKKPYNNKIWQSTRLLLHLLTLAMHYWIKRFRIFWKISKHFDITNMA
jgi:hypothetical protein